MAAPGQARELAQRHLQPGALAQHDLHLVAVEPDPLQEARVDAARLGGLRAGGVGVGLGEQRVDLVVVDPLPAVVPPLSRQLARRPLDALRQPGPQAVVGQVGDGPRPQQTQPGHLQDVFGLELVPACGAPAPVTHPLRRAGEQRPDRRSVLLRTGLRHTLILPAGRPSGT